MKTQDATEFAKDLVKKNPEIFKDNTLTILTISQALSTFSLKCIQEYSGRIKADLNFINDQLKLKS